MSQTADKTPTAYRFGGTDLVLLLLGIAGLISYVYLFPAQHPDSTAVYEISENEAINKANVFLSRQGFTSDGLEITAHLVRRPDLLLDLQRTLGRQTTVEFLESDNRNQIAAYFWSVNYYIGRDSEGGSFVEVRNPIFIVQLAQEGSVLAFENRTLIVGAQARLYGSALERINRSALSSIIRADTSSNLQARAALRAIPDSVFASSLRFDLDVATEASGNSLLNALQLSRPVSLDSSRIVQLMKYHLDRTALADVTWKIDSMSVISRGPVQMARLVLHSEPPIAGQHIIVEASLPITGTLSRLDVSYNPDREDDSGLTSVLTIIRFGLIALLGFVIVVVFFRRLSARLLDVKSALVDSMVLGILAGSVVVMNTTELSSMLSGAPLWGNVLIRLIVFSIIAGVVAIFTFMIAGVTDSVVRETYEDKLGTLILLRHGDFQNKPMGASLTRGLSIGAVMLGISVLVLQLFPGLHLDFSRPMMIDSSFRPMIAESFAAFESSYFLTLMLIVGVGTFAYRWSSKPILTIALITGVGSLIQIGPMPLQPGFVTLGVSALFALTLALTFVRYDILTAMVALFSVDLMWGLSEGFLVVGGTGWIDLFMGSVFLGSVLILGFVGVASKRTGQQVITYVPEYVTEMAGHERVKTELEIAHQVQSFFLPRKMPEVKGLDIAGMCLSATEVGGDYYDFITLEKDRLAFVLGDVSGKGIQAAFFMTLVKGIVQTLSRQSLSPADVMRKLNHLFCQNAPAGTFISVIYGVVDPINKTFTFARAGHNPAILYRAETGQAEALRPKGMAIGFSDSSKFDDNIEEVVVDLKNGDALVFYTDGFSEAMNRSRDLYGDDRLVEKMTHIGKHGASAILRLMTEDVHHFIEGMGRTDDMTMAVLKLSVS